MTQQAGDTMSSRDDNEFMPDDSAPDGAADGAPAEFEPGALEALRAERDELRDRLMRAQAECANISKRAVQQQAQAARMAGLQLMRSLLPVLDDLDRTIAAMPEESADDPLVVGVQLVRDGFVKALQEEGVAPIEAIGAPFDPMIHEALLQDFESEAAPGTVTQEFQRGYRLHDRVLRPALVAVAAAPANKSAEGDNEGNHADV